MDEVHRRRHEGRELTEKLSGVLVGGISDVEEDIRFTYLDDSFRLWWGERGDEETSAIITFKQLRTLDKEELKRIIRTAVLGR